MTPAHPRDGFFIRLIWLTSVLLAGAVAFLILGPRPAGVAGALDVSVLPTVNAAFNSLSTLLLLSALVAIKRRNITWHRRLMFTAFGTSAAFLVSYVIYHAFKEGPKPYVGDHKGIYLIILLTHVVLAAAVLPLQLLTLYRGWRDQREKHRKIARFTLPIWLYVSVTGVVIYWMLYG